MSAVLARRESKRDREHRHDREVIAAVTRRERAAAGHGFKFRLPSSLREKS
jgi:hypothetical protein